MEWEACAECGFVYDLGDAASAARSGRELAAEVAWLLRADGPDLRARPRQEVWSPLEYGCHLRDVFLVQRERLLAARRAGWDGGTPQLAPMGRHERVENDGYAAQDPQDVARQLCDAALLFGGVLDRLDADDWAREVVYPFPEPEPRSLAWVALHTVHEAQHHLMDIRRQLG